MGGFTTELAQCWPIFGEIFFELFAIRFKEFVISKTLRSGKP